MENNDFSIMIYGEKWHIYLVEADDNVIADEDSAAETVFEQREIYFRKSHLTLHYVRHELFHAFFEYTYTGTADLTAIQSEEVSCELFSSQGPQILTLADSVFTNLVKLRDQKEIK